VADDSQGPGMQKESRVAKEYAACALVCPKDSELGQLDGAMFKRSVQSKYR
jgi:hypothetical protein